jgi:hypothetical protein
MKKGVQDILIGFFPNTCPIKSLAEAGASNLFLRDSQI